MDRLPKASLVTGGSGFLGSHLCDRLLERGREVYCLDNLCTGRLTNISHLMGNPHFHFIEHDICSPLPELDVDEVWNLACAASPPRYQRDPVHTMMTNVIGTRNCLELAKGAAARFFQTSTSEVYGDPSVHPQPESYTGSVSTIGPRACYDEGKRAAETLCFDYHRLHGVDIKVVRVFNTYGPRMDPEDGRVVSNFIVRALKGQDLELYGGGTQTRSFCYVDDLIGGFLRLMETQDGITGPVNIGNPDEFTIAELADMVLAMTGASGKLVLKPRPQDDPRQRRPDISRAIELLGWSPTVPLADGLQETITYFRNELSATTPALKSMKLAETPLQ